MRNANKFLTMLLRLLRPGAVFTILLFLISGAGVIFVLTSGREHTVLAYIIYFLSAYALTSLAVSIPLMITNARLFFDNNDTVNRLVAFAYENKYISRIIDDASLRLEILLYASLAFNSIYAAFRLFSAYSYASLWFGAEAILYIVMSVAFFILLRHLRKKERTREHEYRVYRFCGIFLFLVNAALTGVVYQIVHQGMGRQYSGILIYGAAIYAFVCLAAAIFHIVYYRKYKSPILSAATIIRLAQALVAMFSLQTAMFAAFGDDRTLERVMNGVVGGLLCCAIFYMAVSMVIIGSANLAKLKAAKS